ncbi:MAG: lysophospholipase [Bacteroidota bacterium]
MPKQSYTIKSNDNIDLFTRKWAPDGPPQGAVCLVHGLGEHSGRYEHVATAFNKVGFVMYSYDQRGHGKSDGKRGDVPSYNQLLADLGTVLDHIKSSHADISLFLYGHSMGGNVVANYIMAEKRTDIKATIITSPWFTLAFDPPKWQLSLGKFILKVAPGLTQPNKLNPDDLSRDKQVGIDYMNDPLVHNKISPRLFFGIHNAGLEVIENAKPQSTSILVVHGANDPITSPHGSERFAKNANAEYKLWHELLHETHNETNKEEVIEFNIRWLTQHL